MTTVKPKDIVNVGNIIDLSKVYPVLGFPSAGIRPYNNLDLPEIYSNLTKASEGQPWNCYLSDAIPSKYHFSANSSSRLAFPRMTPIYCIPSLGGGFVTRENKLSKGAHGYDNFLPDMRAIFLASGPAFKNVTRERVSNEQNNVVKSFENVEVYNIISRILDLCPAPNNGTHGGILWSDSD